jgi:hypothetical protein
MIDPDWVSTSASAGQAGKHSGSSHWMHSRARASSGQLLTIRTPDLRGLKTPKCSKEQVNSQARHSVHFSTVTISRWTMFTTLWF